MATVVEQKKDIDEGTYTPIFRFYTHDKDEVRIEDNVATSPPAFSIGEQVKVAYQKDFPREAVILTYWGSFGGAMILIGISLILLFISGSYYWATHFLSTLTVGSRNNHF
ncbi:hypothetical protein A4D02_15285 [Niastella koreensis]|nr:hypothetical protein A4D02_15285 [Niastella koreensis]